MKCLVVTTVIQLEWQWILNVKMMVVVTHDAYNCKDINGVYWVYFFKQGYSLQGINFEWLNEHHRSHTLL